MASLMKWILKSGFLFVVYILLTIVTLPGCKYQTSPEKGSREAMQRHYIGRFSIAIPASMEQKTRSSSLRYATVEEVVWRKDVNPEVARAAEWGQFEAYVKKITPPEGRESAIIENHDFPRLGKWARGTFYYNDDLSFKGAEWSLLLDAGPVGVWLKTDHIDVEEELEDPKSVPNYENIAKAYQPLDLKNLQGPLPNNRFYLQHGVINLPYAGQEESIVRFEGHPLGLKLVIEMYMDFTKEIEKVSLINGTRAMLLAALVTPGGSMSKIRLRKREVAGMPGEEAVLKVREGDYKDLVFTWQYNGKDDCGEYPTTKIEMESDDASHLDEKLEIWDAILDSMKPMFERKKL